MQLQRNDDEICLIIHFVQVPPRQIKRSFQPSPGMLHHACKQEPKVASKPTGLDVDESFVAGEVHAHKEALVLLVEHHHVVGGV